MERAGREGSFDSRVLRCARRFERHARVRFEVWIACGWPLRVSSSAWGYCAEQEAVVRVRRERWESVTERDEFVGRFNWGSRFPQYLIEVRLVGMVGRG